MSDPFIFRTPWRPRYEARTLILTTITASLLAFIAHVQALPDGLFFEALIILSVPALKRVPKFMWLYFRQHRLHGFKTQVMPLKALRARHLKDPQQLFLGHGFTWGREEGQWAHDLLEGHQGLLRKRPHRPGAHWVHGLAPREQALYQPVEDGRGHLLIVGTTGSGKTRTFDLLIAQAVFRGEAVIIIDPKGDRDLHLAAVEACRLVGKEEQFMMFHPAFPESSIRIDPLRNFTRASELAARIAQIMPSQGPGDPFKAYSQKALDHVIQGMLLGGERPTLLKLRRCFDGGLGDVLSKALERHCEKIFGEAFKTKIPAIKGSRGDHRAAALIRFYRDHLKTLAPLPDLEGLMALFEHDATHFSKMVASLLPILNMLTSGSLGALLSPDPRNVDDPRRMTDIARIIERREVAYFGLDSLSDSLVGSAMGAILLSDLAAVAGQRYNYGKDLSPVHLFIDEAAEVMNDPCIQLLNKGRGASVHITIATQTFADFTARLGSEAKARQVLANVNNLIALRILDAETQHYVVNNLPIIRRRSIMRSHGAIHPGQHPVLFSGNQNERLEEDDASLFPAALLGQLPDLHYVGKFAGGLIVKGRLPLLIAP
ncbi:MAG: conjugative transfer system coupling protein TraD [Methylococcaceae bacterium]|jgi:conjugal transfer pilus assembly protein TraD